MSSLSCSLPHRLTGFLAFDYAQGNATVADQQVSFVIETVLPYWAATECRVCLFFFPSRSFLFMCRLSTARNAQSAVYEAIQRVLTSGLLPRYVPPLPTNLQSLHACCVLRCLHPRALFLHLFDVAIEQCECSRSFCVAYNMQ